MTKLPLWQRTLVAIGATKIVIGMVVMLLTVDWSAPERGSLLALRFAQIAVYASAGWVLIAGGARDRRAVLLGAVFVLTASVFADTLARLADDVRGPIPIALQLFFAVQADAFSPYFLWRFAGYFPRGPDFGRRQQLVRAAAKASVAVGAVLLVLNVLRLPLFVHAAPGWLAELTTLFSRRERGSAYWPMVFSLALPALVMLWSGRRRVSLDERRRVALLTLGLVVCAGPTLLWVIASEMWPAFKAALPLRIAGFVLLPLLLFLPVWTTYVVRVHHALDVRLVARRAVQYALARQTTLLLVTVPFVVLVFEAYDNRSQSLASLLGGPAGVSLGVLALLGVVGVRGHRAMLDWLDRRYFREQYDARQILADLVERCRRARSRPELAEALRTQLARALHPERSHLLVLDERVDAFTSSDADVQPLHVSRPLLELAAARDGAFDTDLELHNGELTHLPEDDRSWVVDSGTKLCVPLKRTDGTLIGLLLLGEKKSDLPYSDEDRRWLDAVGAAAALALSSLLADDMRRSGDGEAADRSFGMAVECPTCGGIYAASRTQCERCQTRVMETQLPLIVAGKFRLTRRVGDGAMGVVYRGMDVQLSRPVAIKTLPRLNLPAAARLRREARVIASVSHPNLASIYGVESWRGMPMLVLELLSGGTLADRLTEGPMPSAEALQVGVSLAEALGAVHRAGILHRDVKPSNIGFTADGVPKLLDFGVSRLLDRAADERPVDSADRHEVHAAIASTDDDLRLSTTADGRVVGTLLYLSPEALNAERPTASFDLWSLCVVLFEAIAGRHPLRSATIAELVTRITRCDVPDIRTFLPGADPSLAKFFQDALSPRYEDRPRTAAELRGQLQALLER